MSWYECLTCGAVYETPQGVREYYHRCPRVPDPSFASPAPGEPDFRPMVARPDERDENIDTTPGGNYGRPKKQGKGRRPTSPWRPPLPPATPAPG